MNNRKQNFNELPKHVKFATFNSYNEDEILLEIFIANLIYNGSSFNQLLKCTDEIKDKKDKEEMIALTTNIILDFINLNPEFANVLEQNDKAHEFLNSLGINF